MRNSVFLAVLCGILYVFSFAPWDFAHLQWIAFLPLFLSIDLMPASLRNRPWGPLFLIGMIPSAVITLGGFYWMVHATQEYGGLPFGAAVALWLLFALVNQMQIPLYLMLRRSVVERLLGEKSGTSRIILTSLLLGAVYSGIESFYPKLFLDTAGHAFYRSSWVRQWADLGGPFGITVLILACNELLYLTLRISLNPSLRTRARPLWAWIGVAAILIASYGRYREQQFAPVGESSTPTFRVAMIQANIGDYLKLAAERGGYEATEEVMDRYLRLSRLAGLDGNPPDAVIWPETAYPAILGQPKTNLESRMNERLNAHLKDSSFFHFIGGYDANEQREEFNSLFFLSPGGEMQAVYHKSILLMFGETLPFAEVFPSMKSWFPTMGFFGRGPGPKVYAVSNRQGVVFRFAPSICYEGLFPDYSAAGALQNADALLNVTNDSWFGPHGEPFLHLALTQFRAIETRLPLIRSTNTGISVIIDSSGETKSSSGLGTEEVVAGEIRKTQGTGSPYLMMASVFGGNWFTRLCQLLTLSTLIALRSRRSRQS
jgi:apolipoprotein N-acyltransferase